jgi:hypothetical protein
MNGPLLHNMLFVGGMLETLNDKYNNAAIKLFGLLYETKIDDLKIKYPEKAEMLNQFKDVPQKYIEWIARVGLKNIHDITRQSAISVLKQNILDYDKLVQRNKIEQKDINTFKEYPDFDDAVQAASIQLSATEQRKQSKQNIVVLYSDERYMVIQPLDKAASCYYGKGTKWCISATKDQNYFNDYSEKGVEFYFIIDKKSESELYNKVAIAAGPDGDIDIYDSSDHQMRAKEVAGLYPKPVLNALNPYTNNIFKTAKEKYEELAASAKNDEEYIELLNKIMKEASIEEDTAMGYKDLTNTEARSIYGVILQAIDKMPLRLIPQTSYFIQREHVATVELVARLRRENLSIDDTLQMAKTTYSGPGGYFASSAPHDIYHSYFKALNLSLEDMKKLYHFRFSISAFFGNEFPFLGLAADKYMNLYENKLHVKPLNVWFFNDFFRAKLKEIVVAQQTRDGNKILDLMDEIKKYVSIDNSLILNILRLYKEGQLPDPPLAALKQ